MAFLRPFYVLALVPVLFGQAPADSTAAPETTEQSRIIKAIREGALAYDSNLPNFICNQTTSREIRRESDQTLGVRAANPRGGGGTHGVVSSLGQWEPVDSLEEQLSYFGHRETYQVLKMNGRSVAPGTPPQPGLVSSGEFGSTLGGIFDERSHAALEWKRPENLRGRPVYVFTFKIAQENSAAEMSAGKQKIVVGYHGQVYADRDTLKVLRVTTEAEVPPGFPLQNVKHVLDYGPAVIAGESFLLPLHGEMELRTTLEYMQRGTLGGNSSKVTLRNRVDFIAYRKYGVEATLKPE